jgi:tRNA-specific 2-thiouridylase
MEKTRRGEGAGKQARAICLLSGGLDSALAARLVLDQGVGVTGVHFIVPFIRRSAEDGSPAVGRVAGSLGIEVEMVPLGSEYLETIRHPRHGYGANMNPCIDCRIFMLAEAARMMEARGMDFVITGEVVGQRPMSQRLDAMRRVEKESGLEGRLLRPLSAHLLAPTVAEKEGLVSRDLLLGVSGRSRRDLLELAARKNVTGFSAPAGGCLLTDPLYARRIRDLIEHDMFTLHDIDLIGAGRNFRLPGGGKLVVGRNELENGRLSNMADGDDVVLETLDVPGPTAVLTRPGGPDDQVLAARVVARYSDAAETDKVKLLIRGPGGTLSLEVSPLGREVTGGLMI